MSDKDYKALDRKLEDIKQSLIVVNKEVLTIDEVVLLTGLSKSYLYKLTHRRAIPFYKPEGRLIYFKKTEIEAWLLRNRSETVDERDSRIITQRVIKKKVNNPRRSPDR